MATLYEIDQAILDCIDPETGEIIDAARLDKLQMQRTTKIENVALWIKNLRNDAEGYKIEKEAFAEREKQAKAKIESLSNWLSTALNGEKMSTTKVAINFRKSEAVEVNEEEFMNFVNLNLRDDLLTFKDPTPNKTAIKAAIKSGQNINGAMLIEKQNIQIK